MTENDYSQRPIYIYGMEEIYSLFLVQTSVQMVKMQQTRCVCQTPRAVNQNQMQSRDKLSALDASYIYIISVPLNSIPYNASQISL
jgi:hypothetical protein